MFFITCTYYNWDASTARYTRFRPHDTLHRFRNNATVDVNANSAVDVFGTHTHTYINNSMPWNDVGCHGV